MASEAVKIGAGAPGDPLQHPLTPHGPYVAQEGVVNFLKNCPQSQSPPRER